MARVDYSAIEQQIKALLSADTTLVGVTIEVERDGLTSPELCPWIGVYLEKRRIERRPIAAGTRMDYRISFLLWCYEYHMESLATANTARDDLIGKVEVALMKNPTLGGTVTMMALADDAGEFDTAAVKPGFLSGGSIHIDAVVKATTA